MLNLPHVMLSLSKHDVASRHRSTEGRRHAAGGVMLRQAQHDVCFDKLSMTLSRLGMAMQ
jgi:hypothetical protein